MADIKKIYISTTDVTYDIKDEVARQQVATKQDAINKVFLQKNIIEGINILTQDMLSKDSSGGRIPNTDSIFVIQYDYDLDGESITIPDRCTLEFVGGSISNGTLIGNYTVLSAEAKKISDTDVTFSGTWNITESYPEWFGAVPDGETDCSAAINKLLNTKGFTTIKFGNGTYLCNLVINNNVYQLNGSGGGNNNAGYSNTILKAYDPTLPIIKIDTNLDWGRPYNQINNILFMSAAASTSIQVTNKTGIGIAFNYPNPEHSDSGRLTLNYCLFFGFEKAIYKPCGNLGVTLNYCWIRNCKYGYYAHDSQTEYAGHDYFFNTYFDFNEVGYVLYEKTKRAIILVNFESCGFESNNVCLFTDTFMPHVVIKDSWLEAKNNQFNNVNSVVIDDYEGNEVTIPNNTDIYSRNTVFLIDNTRLGTIRLNGTSIFKLKDCSLASSSSVEKDDNSVLETSGGFINNNIPVTITKSPSNRNGNPDSFGGGAFSCMVTERKGNIADYIYTGKPIFGFVFNKNTPYDINQITGCSVVSDGLSTDKALKITGNGVNTQVRLTNYFKLQPNKYYLFSCEFKNLVKNNHIRIADLDIFPRTITRCGIWQRAVTIFNTSSTLNGSTNRAIYALLSDKDTSEMVVGHAQIIEYDTYENAYYDFFSNTLYASNYSTNYRGAYFIQASPSRFISQYSRFISTNLSSSYKEVCRTPSFIGSIVMKIDGMATESASTNENARFDREIEFNTSDTATVMIGSVSINVKTEVSDGELIVQMNSSAAVAFVGEIKIGNAKSPSSDKYKVYGNGYLLNYGDSTLPNLPIGRKGTMCFINNKLNVWTGYNWAAYDGSKSAATSGTFANVPTVAANSIPVGFRYFCTDKQTTEGATDGIEIIHKGSDIWVDALGRVIS